MGRFTNKFTEEQEKAILSLYVTHIGEDIFFVKDTLPPEQWATLGAAYSRTHEPFQERLLKAIEQEDIDVSVIDGLLKNKQTLSNKKLAENAANFIKKWAQEYGHNSIKELGMVRFCAENIPDLTVTRIAMNPLTHMQVKSSRYMDWKNILSKIESNLDIKSSKYGEEIFNSIKGISEGYNEVTELSANHILNSRLNENFASSTFPIKLPFSIGWSAMHLYQFSGETEKMLKKFQNFSRTTVFDSTRYLLTPAMPTSMAVSIDTRALEDVITDLLSSPMLEDQRVGEELLAKGKHVEPILLGEKCHAKKSNYVVETRKELEGLAKNIFSPEGKNNYRVCCIPKNVNMFSDLQIASSIIFNHSNHSFIHIYNELRKNPKQADEIIKTVFKHREKHDPVKKEMNHGGLMMELLMDYGGYRDVHRHRRGTKSLQKLTMEHGFETPELIEVAFLKEKYDKLMRSPKETFEMVKKDNPYLAQLVVPFGYKSRSLLSWGIAQWIYFVELRSKETGNMSYREIAWDVEKILKKKVPKIAGNINVDKTKYPADLINMPDARKWYNKEIRKKDS